MPDLLVCSVSTGVRQDAQGKTTKDCIRTELLCAIGIQTTVIIHMSNIATLTGTCSSNAHCLLSIQGSYDFVCNAQLTASLPG